MRLFNSAILFLAGFVLLSGCDSGGDGDGNGEAPAAVYGTYDLISVNNESLPTTVGPEGNRASVVSGEMVLSPTGEFSLFFEFDFGSGPVKDFTIGDWEEEDNRINLIPSQAGFSYSNSEIEGNRIRFYSTFGGPGAGNHFLPLFEKR